MRVLCSLALMTLGLRARAFVSPVFIHKTSSRLATGMESVYPSNVQRFESPAKEETMPLISFPGGGIFFYWQAGAVMYLDSHFNMTRANVVGASAGALTGTLAACRVPMPLAAEEAIKLSMDNRVWSRRLGLAGIWGPIVRQWLDNILPQNADELCRDRVHLYVAFLEPGLQPNKIIKRERITDFRDKADLINCCLSSTHIPFFMDGRPAAKFRGRRCIDGSFLLDESHLKIFHDKDPSHPTLILDHSKDSELGAKGIDFVKLTTPEGIKNMMRLGYRAAQRMHEEGAFEMLEPLRIRR